MSYHLIPFLGFTIPFFPNPIPGIRQFIVFNASVQTVPASFLALYKRPKLTIYNYIIFIIMELGTRSSS